MERGYWRVATTHGKGPTTLVSISYMPIFGNARSTQTIRLLVTLLYINTYVVDVHFHRNQDILSRINWPYSHVTSVRQLLPIQIQHLCESKALMERQSAHTQQ